MTLPEGVEKVLPGDNVNNMRVKLIQKVAIEDGSEFAIREGGLTVGAGRITKMISKSLGKSGRTHGCLNKAAMVDQNGIEEKRYQTSHPHGVHRV